MHCLYSEVVLDFSFGLVWFGSLGLVGFDKFGLVCLVWYVWFGRFKVVGLVW